MRHQNAEFWKVQEVSNNDSELRRVFREQHVGASRRQTLNHAAAAVSASTDEMLAVAAYRKRHQAVPPVAPQVEAPLPGFETEITDGELV